MSKKHTRNWSAAGPDMLEALQAVEPYVAHFLGSWSTHTHARINTADLHRQITAAIAKATSND